MARRRTLLGAVSLAVAALLGLGASTAANAAGPASTAQVSAARIQGVHPELNGHRIKTVNSATVYLVLDGKRRAIPNQTTYFHLFRSWDGIENVIDIESIDDGGSLSDGAMLAKSPSSATVYLVSNGIKRAITSRAVFDKYAFDWDKIVTVSAVVLDAVPDGPVISS
ncbi:hypothetical protein [Streptomyces hygroscopicus]|uniref:hypothetical protein n=1 Tax=Streptomyces hygroscopicus TaxID=1912 RepID=UPI0004C4B6A1|nr:hypothetical protein [Streptomyces hygroscopicus]